MRGSGNGAHAPLLRVKTMRPAFLTPTIATLIACGSPMLLAQEFSAAAAVDPAPAPTLTPATDEAHARRLCRVLGYPRCTTRGTQRGAA